MLVLGPEGRQLGDELSRCGCDVRTEDGLPTNVDLVRYDWVLALDLVEHLASPEGFAEGLRDAARFAPEARLIVSTGNVASIWTRVGLAVGQFNYSKRGILDITHMRLFTFRSLRRLFEQANFDVVEVRGVPAPFPLVFGEGRLARFLLKANGALIWLRKSLFSYQIVMVLKPRPSLPYLLMQAKAEAGDRVARMATGGQDSNE